LGDDTNTNLHIDYGCERKFMMRALKQKPTLDRPATYQIQVPGELDESLSDWIQGMTIAVESEGEDPPVTTLTGTVDQATSHGLLKKVRNPGVPLLSVNRVESEQADAVDSEQSGDGSSEQNDGKEVQNKA
jgi:hypothetical protein